MKLPLPLAFSIALLLVPDSFSAPAPTDSKKRVEPTVTLQIKSVDELLGTLKATVKTFVPEKLAKNFEQEVLAPLDPAKLKGVALNRPFGLYAVLGDGLPQQNFSKSFLVALIPIQEQKAFLELLDQSGLHVEKNGDLYSIPVPNAPVKVTLRFLKGHAYVIVATDEIDPKTLLEPKELFDDTEKAAFALRVRADRLPNDLRKAASEFLSRMAAMATTGIIGLGGQEMSILALLPMMLLAVDEDAKEVIYRLDLDAKTGVFSNEVTVEPKKGSGLARSISGMRPTRNEFAGIVGDDSVAHLLVQTPLFAADIKSFLGKGVNRLAKLADDNISKLGAPKEAEDAVKEAFKTLKRTMDEGTLDLAVSLRGPDKNGQFTAVGALSLKEPAELEKSLKAVLAVLPKEVAGLVKLDSFKVNGVSVHEIAVGDMLPPEPEKAFGKSSIYVALAPNAGFIAFGAQGKSIISDLLSKKLASKPAPLVQSEISSKRLIPLFKSLGAPTDGDAIAVLENLGKTERQPLLAVKVQGGERLVLRFEIGLPALFAVGPRAQKVDR